MAGLPKAIEVYISYSTKDEELKKELENHLASLEQEGLITIWSDSEIIAGSEWKSEIYAHLKKARIVLLLVSPDFLTSNFAFSVEMQQAIQRHTAMEAVVIPVILRRAEWLNTPIGKLQALPSHGRPVTEWATRDEAYLDIVSGIRKVVQLLLQEPYPASPVISGFTSDDLNGQDQLGFKKEVGALCSVLASKNVEPPLSLGLFGDWGSGKSFFMRMMQERIEKLKEAAQQAEGETAYCKNIVQLKFNAWHYIDTDLWASLTSEIFEGLARALVKKDDADSEYKRAHLLANAIKSKDDLAKAEQEKIEADAKLQESEENLKKLERDASAIEANLTPKALVQGTLNVAIRQPEVREAVEETKKDLNTKLAEAAKDLNYPTHLTKESEVKAQIQDLNGIWGSVRALAIAIRNTKDKGRLQLIIAALVVVLGISLLAIYRASLAGLLGSVIVLIVGIIVPVAPLIPGILRALRIIKQVQEERTRLIEDARQRSRAVLLQEVVNAQQRVEKAQKRVEDASAKVRDNEKEMENLSVNRQMTDFIKQRQASTVYTKHLGVIAQAREDFEKLSILLAKEKEDAEKGTPVGQEEQLLPRIDRIILYIDDLDRCPEDQVVDVLQAVHLLLAFPLFIVVVGVDSRWLLHSLKQHSRAFQSEVSERDGIPDDEQTQWQSTPLNYLEKIFQIPFTLRPMQVTGFERLIDVLTSQQKSSPSSEVKNQQINDEEKSDGKKEIVYQGEVPPSIIDALPQDDIDLNPEYLRIEDWERDFMKKLYSFIPSPRAAKRFVNIYRLLRASIEDLDLQAFIGDKNGGQHRSMLLLLAMLIGYPAETIEILGDLSKRNHSETWWKFIDSFKLQTDSSVSSNNSETPHEVNGGDPERLRQLLDKLSEIRSLIGEDQSIEDFVEWGPQVARYSYQSRPALFAK